MNDKDISIERALESLKDYAIKINASIKILKREKNQGKFKDFPEKLDNKIIEIYKKKGIEYLYSHQAEAIEKVLENKNIVVSTPTSSGKTLIYNILTLNSLIKDPSSRFLYLFPTKALSQDQLKELFDLNDKLNNSIGVYTYDGDTPQSTRKAIRKKAQIVITNPYMLHSGILPHHTKWINLFSNLKYIIIDELHYYTGVFGSHVANVIRRLKRIAKFYGSNPQFILSSATISNPVELGEKIIEESLELINNSGSPSGEKYFVFFNPPVVNRELGIRMSYINAARSISSLLLNNDLQVITFTNARLITEILVKYLKNDFEKSIKDKDKIRGYRGGYLPKLRREIEQGLKNGKIKGIVSTNALELGIDIGSLDAAVLASYPGTISSTWQRFGRAGRRNSKSIGVLVSSSMPTDQFIVNNPEYFINNNPETGRINPDNIMILIEHIKCASFELPFIEGEKFGNEDLSEILKYLEENQIILKKGNKWYWTEEGYPADAVSLNRITSDNFVVVDTTSNEKIIGEVDFSSALEILHPGAIYILEGAQYIVEKLDYENRRAYVKESKSDYYTDSITNTKISVLDVFDENKFERFNTFTGEVHVFSQVVGFKKIKFFTNENVGAGDLQLPQREMHTTAFWINIKNTILKSIQASKEEIYEAIYGIGYLLKHISSIILMCDHHDIGMSVEDNSTDTNINQITIKNFYKNSLNDNQIIGEFEPFIYIYDNYPNGIGLSDTIFENFNEILNMTLNTVKNCKCKNGCPSCVGPPISTRGNHKKISIFLLELLLNKIIN